MKKAVDTLRVLAAETISHANSGHSGIALGAAPIMHAIYSHMKIDPTNPDWFNRDRFVMSAGHGSALLYAALHLNGFKISVDDLKTFRKLGSHLTGHPELDTKIGVDCSTGPLGQGVAMAVGLALAEKRLSRMFNKGGNDIIDHYTYVLAGDGCLMEGISYEACNLAAVWKLNKLIMLYDSNNITLDGSRIMADAECVRGRFEATGWNVLEVDVENDENTISDAIAQAKAFTNAPTIIICKTTIGFGHKTAGTSKAHGVVLTAEECENLRKEWSLSREPFSVDTDVKKYFDSINMKKMNNAKQWDKQVNKYRGKLPTEYRNLEKFLKKGINKFEVVASRKDVALRDAGAEVLNQIARQSLRVYGGSADVGSTTKAVVDNAYFAAGVREFAMGAICNGLALHGFTPYCSTFLAFSDYLKPAIRLATMMKLPVTHVFTHDGLGNAPDGPTHQGNEHMNTLRMIPNMTVFRPCDDVEVAHAYEWAFENEKPTSMILSRGNVPSFSNASYDTFTKGAYVVSPENKRHDATLISTGSDVLLCLEAQDMLSKIGIDVRVVSMPSMELFDQQSTEYKHEVLGNCPRIAVEMGNGSMWWRYANDVISFDSFGVSAPDKDAMKHIGFTAQNITQRVFEIFKKN